MKEFIFVLLIAKIGFVANDSVTGFKLMEKGLKEEDLGLIAMINFPLQLLFGYYAVKWSEPPRRLRPWLFAYYGRLVMVLVGMFTVWSYPTSPTTTQRDLHFLLVVVGAVVNSFMR